MHSADIDYCSGSNKFTFEAKKEELREPDSEYKFQSRIYAPWIDARYNSRPSLNIFPPVWSCWITAPLKSCALFQINGQHIESWCTEVITALNCFHHSLCDLLNHQQLLRDLLCMRVILKTCVCTASRSLEPVKSNGWCHCIVFLIFQFKVMWSFFNMKISK